MEIRTFRGWLLAGAGVATFAAMAYLAIGGLRDGDIMAFLPQIIGLMAATVVLLVLGVFAFIPHQEEEESGVKPDYRHTYPG